MCPSLAELVYTSVPSHARLMCLSPADVIDDADDSEAGAAGRFIRYEFSPQFLKLKTVGALYVLMY